MSDYEPTDDLGDAIRRRVKKAVEDALGADKETTAPKDSTATSVNIAAAVNVGQDGHTVTAYSDDDVTIVQRDGETRVVRRRDQADPEQATNKEQP
jgi:hypothetical protein